MQVIVMFLQGLTYILVFKVYLMRLKVSELGLDGKQTAELVLLEISEPWKP